jgi:glycosyltransferase involved in cell wall biosynthesis
VSAPDPTAGALAVVVPAHDEEALVADCLRSVLRALQRADLPSVLVLVAHRCTDRTAEVARAELSLLEEAGPGRVRHVRVCDTRCGSDHRLLS